MSYYDQAVMMELALGRWSSARPQNRRVRQRPVQRGTYYLGYFWLD
ncbi:hypothetical protein [Marivita hallyeonensis]|uniref:Uncharacterized protein n=1 Tax=Marivita hallyeonensis TaxID=996342 RepID=A0A1M5MAK9_9RHOB|nr:hypothetical protein [Marivita hallyeonensis]SHG73733.1 hypothetical protein SAMN05443551_0433 [Marivita hallyeonensis]